MFHINQFYNAVEDEQLYTDEYLQLHHTYRQFLTNSNAMFSRMETGIRSSIDRSISRQMFYYSRYNELTNAPAVFTNTNVAPSHANAAPASAPAHAPATAPASAPATNEVSDTISEFRRLIIDYMNRILLRRREETYRTAAGPTGSAGPTHPSTGTRPTTTTNNNNRLSPYTVLFDVNLTGTRNRNNTSSLSNQILTTDQIRSATMNTQYSNIISPSNTTCPISRDEFTHESDVTQILGCSHIFNRTSLHEWFINHSTCPMCRFDIRNYNATTNVEGGGGGGGGGGVRLPPIRNDIDTINTMLNDESIVNTQDIYNRIFDNSSNFLNAFINNMTDDEITFTYDLDDHSTDMNYD
jgi:hypothetical protein